MKILPIKILILIVFPSLLFAQSIETSPYSAFGLGDSKYLGPAESVSMGGLNSVFWDNVHVNPTNPASYSFLSLTTYSLGTQGRYTQLETSTDSESNSYVGLNHLLIGIPMGKWGAAMGFMPTSSTGYSLNSTDTQHDSELELFDENGEMIYDGIYDNIYSFNGFGGVNRAFLGLSYSPFKGFSMGVNANYQFGNISRSVRMFTPAVLADLDGDVNTPDDVLFEGSQYGTKEEEKLRIKDWQFDMGLLYTGKLNEKLQYTLGATYGLGNESELEYTKYLYTFKFVSNGVEQPIDTLHYVSGTSKLDDISVPSRGSAGISIGNYSKWMIGANYEFKDPIDLTFGTEGYKVSFKQSKKYSVGGYFTPKYNSLMSYWERITYRAGFKYEEMGVSINGTDIVDYSVNFGFGLPVGNGASNISIGGAFGTRGTTDNDLIKENYFNFVVAFSLSDKWFKKVKYY
ncbi:MAG: hypothetical protein ABFR62_00110 [Bacteroidota bacterium]